MRSRPLVAAALCSLILLVTACGDSDDDDSDAAPESGSESGSASEDPELAALLPDEVRDRGYLTVAMSPDEPPAHFTEDSELVGFDPDLAAALGDLLGVELRLSGANFEALIPGLEAGRYDLAMSTIFITEERQEIVDFVSYYDSGSALVVKAGNVADISSLDDVCGRRAAVTNGAAMVDDMNLQSDACVADGREAVEVQVYNRASDTNLAVLSGQADVLAYPSETAGYAAQQNDELEVVAQYASFPTGIVVPKGERELAEAIRAALAQLIEDGTYLELLEAWGMQSGAITDPEILPADG